ATGNVHRCEQMLQNPSCVWSVSSMDGSSQPHLGHRRSDDVHRPSVIGPRLSVAAVDAAAIASPASFLNPFTYISPSRTRPSGWTRHGQSDTCTSIDAKRTP